MRRPPEAVDQGGVDLALLEQRPRPRRAPRRRPSRRATPLGAATRHRVEGGDEGERATDQVVGASPSR